MLVAKLEVAPPNLAERLESLFRLPPAEAAEELGRLVLEVRELSDVELPLRRPPGTKLEPWSVEIGRVDDDVR
jgi:hypothetical protein